MSDLKGQTVAVTGSTGFLGRYLVHTLIHRGAKVVGVVRRPSAAADQLVRWGAELRNAALDDVPSLQSAFAGCDAVIINAGLISFGQHSKARLLSVNEEGARNSASAAAEAGVRRVVLTSSSSAYRKKRGNEPYREADPLRERRDFSTPIGWYGMSKAEGERSVTEVCAARSMALTVFRPGGIYGAWDSTGFTAWFSRLMKAPGITAMPVGMYIPMLYAGDAAATMVRALVEPRSVGRAYNLAGDPELSFWEFLKGYKASGGPAPSIVLPVPFPMRYAYDCSAAANDLGFVSRPPREAFEEINRLTAQDRATSETSPNAPSHPRMSTPT